MNAPLLLAWRHLSHRRVQSGLLIACLALTFALPISVQSLVSTWSERIGARAAATPLVLGSPGSRFDLVLGALYFRGRVPRPLPMAAFERIAASRHATSIPLAAPGTAQGLPLVGTTPDYFGFRGLRFAAGGPPLQLGECVLGAEAAVRLGRGVGDHVLTDRESIWRIEAAYPLRMRVVGVLAPGQPADDAALFASLETVWVAEGLGHGHAPPVEQSQDAVIRRDGDAVVLDASVFEFQEITAENAGSFHFHEDPEELPLTAVLVVPHDAAAATKLKGRYRTERDLQLLEPIVVVEELVGFVLQAKRFFDAHAVLVGVATLALLGLVIALSIRARRREFETLFRLGAARVTVIRAVVLEYGLVLLAGGAVATLLGLGLGAWIEAGWRLEGT